MYVESSFYQNFPQRTAQAPRERYIRYYRDLHERYKIPLNSETMQSGSHYKYNELAYPILDEWKNQGVISNIDTMIMSWWAHEFDPDFATLGPHLMHRYDITPTMFDVIDQGKISAFVGLSLLSKLNCNLAALISLDQTTIPRSDSFSYAMPGKTAAAGLLLSVNQTPNSLLQITDCDVWLEHDICDSRLNVTDKISKLIIKNNIDINNCVICCKRNGVFYRALNIYKTKQDVDFDLIQFDMIPYQFGCTDIIQYIHQIRLSHHLVKEWYLYIDEDVESLSIGLAAIRLL